MSSADGQGREVIFTILSLQNADRDAGHIFEKQGLSILRWDVRPGKVDGVLLFIHLLGIVETSRKDLDVMPEKGPGGTGALFNGGGKNDLGCAKKEKKKKKKKSREIWVLTRSHQHPFLFG